MKKIIVTLVVVVLCAGSYSANAQTSDKVSLLNARTIGADKAAVKANRDFWERVGDGKNEEWYKLPNGYLATFTESEIQNRFVYDPRGNWVYTLLTYREKDMPKEVRKAVKCEYYDHVIGWVKEVRERDMVIYVVHVENETEWKDIALKDGEMTVLHTYCKK